MRTVVLLTITFFAFQLSEAQSLYKVSTIRASPGNLENLIQVKKTELRKYNKQSGRKAYMIRHSQGDHWDLLIIADIGDYETYFEGNLQSLETPYGHSLNSMVSFQEDAYAYGPSPGIFNDYFSKNQFFHVEMFLALAGKQEELLKEREMENRYLEFTDRKPNLIFTKASGFRYDIFTIGAYPDLLTYAKGGNQPEKVQEDAAIKAGFKSAADIGFYLRELLNEHRDTLANKVSIE